MTLYTKVPNYQGILYHSDILYLLTISIAVEQKEMKNNRYKTIGKKQSEETYHTAHLKSKSCLHCR